MANILKQIKVGNITYNIEPVTAYLPLTGGTMTGPIYYQGTHNTYPMIKWINNTSDAYGNGIRIGGGGATIIGGGESSDLPNINGGDEVLYLMNDGAIDFYSNCQEGLNSAQHMTFDVYGTLNVPTNVVGSSNSNRLIFRHLDGQNCNGDYNLYLQYHQRNTKIYLNGTDYYIENGSYYNGTAAAANSVAWGNITGKPSTFTPSGHTHTKSQITDFSHTHTKSEVGLGNVDNTADANKNVNYANSAGSANYFNYGRGAILANSSSFTNNFCKDIFGEENNNNYHLVALRTNSQAPSCLLGDYSSGIAWKGSDTYGSLMVRYNTSEIRVSGGNGANTNPNWTVDLVHSGNIGSQNVNYANSAGSANYATSSHLLRTYNADNGSHGADYYLKCRHNVDGNGRFKLQIVRSDGSVTHSTSVDFATSAGSVAWGNIGGKPSTFPTTVDSSLSSSSSNPVRNSTIYSAFSNAAGFDHDKYAYGDSGSWRLLEYHSTGNTLDIRYGKFPINAQEKTYSVSFQKPLNNSGYAIVCGIYRDDRNSWFWSPLVTSRSTTGFNVYVRGNTSYDKSGILMYIAIRSN